MCKVVSQNVWESLWPLEVWLGGSSSSLESKAGVTAKPPNPQSNLKAPTPPALFLT